VTGQGALARARKTVQGDDGPLPRMDVLGHEGRIL
jgi:hypothetical protein